MEEAVAGTCGAIAMVALTQPIDTVKVNHQTSGSSSGSPLRTGAAFVRARGLTSLWAGTLPSMYAYVAEHAVLFSVYGGVQRTIWPNTPVHETSPVWLGATCAASTLVSSIFLCPADAIKCQLQASPSLQSRRPLTEIGQLVRLHGVGWLYRNFGNIFARDSTFFGVYILSNETIGRAWASHSQWDRQGDAKSQLGLQERFVVGGSSGAIAWTAASPFDVINSRRQTRGPGVARVGFLAELGRTLRLEGLRTLYRGWTFSVMRGFVGYGAFTCVYEYVLLSCQAAQV
jgi:hypothetical protein